MIYYCKFCGKVTGNKHYCNDFCLKIDIKLARLKLNVKTLKNPLVNKYCNLSVEDLILFMKMYPKISKDCKTLDEINILLRGNKNLLDEFNKQRLFLDIRKKINNRKIECLENMRKLLD